MFQLLSMVNGKTYLAGVGFLCAAGIKAYEKDLNGALELAVQGLAVFGIGHKIDKQIKS